MRSKMHWRSIIPSDAIHNLLQYSTKVMNPA